MIIFAGTLITAFVLNVHLQALFHGNNLNPLNLQKIYNKPIPPLVTYIFFHKMAPWFGVRPSTVLLELWQETGVFVLPIWTQADLIDKRSLHPRTQRQIGEASQKVFRSAAKRNARKFGQEEAAAAGGEEHRSAAAEVCSLDVELYY
jgi:hypothetical protein